MTGKRQTRRSRHGRLLYAGATLLATAVLALVPGTIAAGTITAGTITAGTIAAGTTAPGTTAAPDEADPAAAATVEPAVVHIELPLGLPPLPVPDANPLTAKKVALGERLFFDAGLSSDGSVSCAACHRPDNAFADSMSVSPGVAGGMGRRNSPTILNVAYKTIMFWDGRSTDLEDQVRYPVVHPLEMNMKRRELVARVNEDPEYPALFAEVFGPEAEIDFARISDVIAAFERTLLSGDSPFDRYYFGGEEEAISAEAKHGWELFQGRLGCIDCHVFTAEKPFFSDFLFYNNGAGYDEISPDLGRYRVTGVREDKGKFRVPSLRNVALTAPYMHQGAIATLEEVVEFYDEGGFQNLYQDPRIEPLGMSDEEKRALLAFLRSLNGDHSHLSRFLDKPVRGVQEAP